MTDVAPAAAPNRDHVLEGPMSILAHATKTSTPVAVVLRNNHKLLGTVKAFDRHCNLVMTDVREFWAEKSSRKTAQPVARERVLPKLFVRGDSVVIVVKDPMGRASSSSLKAEE